MRRRQDERIVERLVEFLSARAGERYPAVALVGPDAGETSDLLGRAAERLSYQVLDVLTELLPTITSPVLGAYGHANLRRFCEKETTSRGAGLCLDRADGLLATFGQDGAAQFFRSLASWEVTRPVVVVTRMAETVAGCGLPKDQVFHVREEG